MRPPPASPEAPASSGLARWVREERARKAVAAALGRPNVADSRRRPLTLQVAAAGCRGAAAAPAAVAPVQRRRGARIPSQSSGFRRRGIMRGAEAAAHASGTAAAAGARDARLPARAAAARGAARRRQAGEHHGGDRH
eukprot:scaffold37153_cov34-Phaeocystis_antarctica.AAC.3